MKPVKQSECKNCNGAGGYYWDAPIYHNERQREWASCHACIPDRHWHQENGAAIAAAALEGKA